MIRLMDHMDSPTLTAMLTGYYLVNCLDIRDATLYMPQVPGSHLIVTGCMYIQEIVQWLHK